MAQNLVKPGGFERVGFLVRQLLDRHHVDLAFADHRHKRLRIRCTDHQVGLHDSNRWTVRRRRLPSSADVQRAHRPSEQPKDEDRGGAHDPLTPDTRDDGTDQRSNHQQGRH